MLTSPVGLRSKKGCAGDARQKLKTTDQQTRTCLKIIKERKGKIGRGSQMGAWNQDRLVDWLSVVI
jgi:hypothetical protein